MCHLFLLASLCFVQLPFTTVSLLIMKISDFNMCCSAKKGACSLIITPRLDNVLKGMESA